MSCPDCLCNCDLTPILEKSIRYEQQEKIIEGLTHDNALLRAQVRNLQLRLAKLTPTSIYTGEKQHECRR